MTLQSNTPIRHHPAPKGIWIKQKYGSKKGLLRFLVYTTLMQLGFFSSRKQIQFSAVRRLIFICQGNICRSPLAEAIARREGFETDSYGLNCGDNHCADPRTIAFAENLAIDLKDHRTRHIDHYRPQAGDLLIGMEPSHARKLLMLFGAQVPITLAGLWITNSTPYIHDPYNTCDEFFIHCECMVVSAVNSIISQVRDARYTNSN